jgi:hypothetical protein
MTTLAAGPSHTSIIPTLTVCLHSFVVSMSGPAFNSECVANSLLRCERATIESD